jgi:hypothetical protein
MFGSHRPEKPKRLPGGDKYHWTNHVERKMGFYGLTPSRVLRVIRAPDRMEEGIVDGTLAAMQTSGSKSRPWELWVMWREEVKVKKSPIDFLKPGKKIIITAWRYPGVSPVREKVPIPSDIVAELESEGILDDNLQ